MKKYLTMALFFCLFVSYGNASAVSGGEVSEIKIVTLMLGPGAERRVAYIPEGYEAVKAFLTLAVGKHAGSGAVTVVIGGKRIELSPASPSGEQWLDTGQKPIPLSVFSTLSFGFQLVVEIHCKKAS